VYRKIGGYSYDSVYPGPIGKLVTPLMNPHGEYEDLPQASSLCGACFEACPVRIDIPAMLIKMRNDLRKRGRFPWTYSLAFKLWRIGMSSPFLYRWGAKMHHWFLDAGSREGWNTKLPGPLSGWTDYRDFPAMADRSFRERWGELQEDGEKER
jgi:L-lactate dehydrogenase complex protein LldF